MAGASGPTAGARKPTGDAHRDPAAGRDPAPGPLATGPSGPTPLRLTVAICTRDRPATLRDTLTDLARQRVPGGVEWEVLVIDNGSDGRTAATLAPFAERLPLRSAREPEPGLSRARNRAVAEADGDVIVWTDDDVRIGREWIAAFARAVAEEEQLGFFGGIVRPRFESEPPAWLRRAWPQVAELYAIREPPDAGVVRPDYVPFGANFAVRAEVQRRHLFDPELGRRGPLLRSGEEWDAIQRMMADGVRGRWVPAAVVEHRLPAGRLTTAHVREILRRQGEVGAAELARPGETRWAGAPRWLWKRAALSEARYRLHRIVSPAPVWVRHLREASLARGRLDGCRRG